MDIESRLSISFYSQIATISEQHKIYVVQHNQTHKIYIKKILDVYNKDIYEYLRLNPIKHTPKIYEIYAEGNQLEVIEEYISGNTVEQLLDSNFPFTNDKIRDIVIQLCVVLNDLHNCSPAIIHRDIKPSNIIITPSGELFLLDFNAAKYQTWSKSEDTSLLGTKGYAAPEQYGFGVSTTQTDIYAVGVLIKELTSCKAYIQSGQKNEFVPIITKCTKLDATQRYENVLSISRLLNSSDVSNSKPQKEFSAWRRFLPPGFQKLSPISMLLSGTGYAFIAWLCLTLEIDGSTPLSLFVDRILCFIMLISIIFCSANYLNVQSFFPPCRTKNPLLRIMAIVLLDILIFLSFMIFISIFDSILA